MGIRNLAIVVCLAAASASLPAQATVTAPAGYDTRTAGYHASCKPLVFLNGRVQLADPSMPKTKASLTRLDYRTQNFRSYSPQTGQGRKFSTVTLALGHTDSTKLTMTFSTNFRGAPTTVHSAAVSLPSHTSGMPAQIWGNAGAFPFQKTFAYNGTDDLLMDWTTVSKGVLENGAAPLGGAAEYSVDAGLASTALVIPVYGGSPYAPGSRYLPEPAYGKTPCTDSRQIARGDAHVYYSVLLYAETYATTSLRGKAMTIFSRGLFLAPSAPYVGVVAGGGFDAGIDIGAGCNKLHVFVPAAAVVVAGKTNSLGTTPDWVGRVPIMYPPSFVGKSFYAQAAWDDSRTKRFSLTKAVKLVLPQKPTGKSSWPANTLIYEYTDNTGNKTGPFGPVSGASLNLTERFTTK